VFVGKLVAVIIGAKVVGLGMAVSLGRGLFVAAGPPQLLSSAKITTKYKSDHVRLSFAMKFFIEVISWK
jgi:hypothetical protein